ncbi:MAG TPA: hypothetical protein VFT74_20320 [Isosphaeraceae bacterium]|nr:hypothetical protein [Isosphaeraceae bacterium]
MLGTDLRRCVPVAELSDRFEVEPSTLLTALAEQVALDLPDVWQSASSGPSVCLSPLGRHRSGRRPSDECDWTPPGYWSQTGDADAVEHADALPDPRALEVISHQSWG